MDEDAVGVTEEARETSQRPGEESTAGEAGFR